MSHPSHLSRRTLLGAGGAALAALGGVSDLLAAPARRSFPKGFLWGAATSGHQVEGADTGSDMWVMEHVRPTLFREPSGDACDSLHRWEEDLDLVRAIGLNTYRFSVEWSRIEPAPGEFSTAWLDHYARILEGCHRRGLKAVVTFSHYSVPAWFAGRGSFFADDSADLFARFCDQVARRLAAGIAYGVTLNEPNIGSMMRWIRVPEIFTGRVEEMLAAAGKAVGSDRFRGVIFGAPASDARMIEAHIKAYQAIKAVRGDLPLGVGLAVDDDQVQGSASYRDAKRRAVYEPWFAATRSHGDFIGVQNYGRRLYDANGEVPLAGTGLGGRQNVPEALGNAVRFAHEGTGKPVLITENGVDSIDDAKRAAFIPATLAGLHQTIAAGTPVLGYIHWSLLDNFEWISGYHDKFGLVAVDRTTFARTIKPSARVFGAIARANALG
jgi:beta-glucosidase